MSSYHDLGSSGDSQARILDRSLAMIKLFDTLTMLKELTVRRAVCHVNRRVMIRAIYSMKG